jgi:hypothetical protein
MNYWLMGLVISFGVMSDVSAQDKGGWGRRHKNQEQQQQQAPKKVPKKKVIRGEKAKAMYFEMIEQGGVTQDLSRRCFDPVRRVKRMTKVGTESCFEFGYPGSMNNRYKCYVYHPKQETTRLRNWIFDQIHPQCE